jgi:hypothetical protein
MSGKKKSEEMTEAEWDRSVGYGKPPKKDKEENPKK